MWIEAFPTGFLGLMNDNQRVIFNVETSKEDVRQITAHGPPLSIGEIIMSVPGKVLCTLLRINFK